MMFDWLTIGVLCLIFVFVAAGVLGFIYSELEESGRFDRGTK